MLCRACVLVAAALPGGRCEQHPKGAAVQLPRRDPDRMPASTLWDQVREQPRVANPPKRSFLALSPRPANLNPERPRTIADILSKATPVFTQWDRAESAWWNLEAPREKKK